MLLSHAEEGDDVGHSGDKKLPEWANSVELNSFMLELFDCRRCVIYPALAVCVFTQDEETNERKNTKPLEHQCNIGACDTI